MFSAKKLALAIAVTTAMGLGASAAHAAVVSSITVTGGTFSMGQDDTLSTCTAATSVDFGNCHQLAPGTANTLNDGDTGVAKTTTTAFSPDIAHFNFFGSQQVTAGIAPSASGAANANDWASGLSGTTGVGTMQLNLGGWYANWTGTNFLQGTDQTGANGTSTFATAWSSACSIAAGGG